MKISELVDLPVVDFLTEAKTFSPTDRVSQVIGHLRESNSYEAVVAEDDRTSIISIRDLINVTSLETKLESLMHQIPRLNQHNTVGDASTLMFEHRSRTLPVYSGKALLGLATSPSIVARLVDSTDRASLESIMTPEPITVPPSSMVSTARDLMRRKKIDQVPVVDEKVVGIITSARLVFNLMPLTDRTMKGDWVQGRYSEQAGTYSSKDVTTNDLANSLKDVYLNMSTNGANYSLVLARGELKGIVTYRDFLRLLSRKVGAPALPMYIVGLPEDAFEASEVRRKFLDSIELLRKSLPGVTEARAVIRSGESRNARRKSQVKVLILTPTNRHAFSTSSYSLAEAFGEVHEWAKKLAAREKPSRERPTQRREFSR